MIAGLLGKKLYARSPAIRLVMKLVKERCLVPSFLFGIFLFQWQYAFFGRFLDIVEEEKVFHHLFLEGAADGDGLRTDVEYVASESVDKPGIYHIGTVRLDKLVGRKSFPDIRQRAGEDDAFFLARVYAAVTACCFYPQDVRKGDFGVVVFVPHEKTVVLSRGDVGGLSGWGEGAGEVGGRNALGHFF